MPKFSAAHAPGTPKEMICLNLLVACLRLRGRWLVHGRPNLRDLVSAHRYTTIINLSERTLKTHAPQMFSQNLYAKLPINLVSQGKNCTYTPHIPSYHIEVGRIKSAHTEQSSELDFELNLSPNAVGSIPTQKFVANDRYTY